MGVTFFFTGFLRNSSNSFLSLSFLRILFNETILFSFSFFCRYLQWLIKADLTCKMWRSAFHITHRLNKFSTSNDANYLSRQTRPSAVFGRKLRVIKWKRSSRPYLILDLYFEQTSNHLDLRRGAKPILVNPLFSGFDITQRFYKLMTPGNEDR